MSRMDSHSKSRGLFSVSALSILVLAAGCKSPSLTRTSASPLTDGLPDSMRSLPEVLKRDQSGLDLESPDERAKLLKDAERYVAFRRSTLSARERASLRASCGARAGADPFCGIIAGRRRLEASRRGKHRARDASSSARVLRLFNKGDFAALDKVDEIKLIGALKQVNEFGQLARYAAPVMASPTCRSTALMSALGLKAENFFPDEDAKTMASKLYGRALECGSDASAMRSSYRLGLLKMWAGAYGEAEEALSKFIDDPNAVDYRSRMLYWRMRAALQARNENLAKQMRERLRREYPMTLHGLLANAKSEGETPLLSHSEPELAFRSASKTELNGPITAVEALQAIGQPEMAFDALEPFLDALGGTEPGFRLYVAVLLMRSGETIRKFQIITGLFREHPSFVSKASLEMLYPLRRLDLVAKFNGEVDPLLVLSLIRQESAFNAKARSRAGAVGLMQLMPGTARIMAGARMSRKSLFDPELNVKYGVKFFSRLLERFSNDAELALAAYNAGPERVDEWMKRYPMNDRLLFLDLVPFRETREYVASISRNYFWYMKLYATHLRETSLVARAVQVGGVRLPSSESLLENAEEL